MSCLGSSSLLSTCWESVGLWVFCQFCSILLLYLLLAGSPGCPVKYFSQILDCIGKVVWLSSRQVVGSPGCQVKYFSQIFDCIYRLTKVVWSPSRQIAGSPSCRVAESNISVKYWTAYKSQLRLFGRQVARLSGSQVAELPG